nr:SRPBCC family protein [Burkholderia savannae]
MTRIPSRSPRSTRSTEPPSAEHRIGKLGRGPQALANPQRGPGAARTDEDRETTMADPAYVYVTYIASTPERVFDALTNAELTKEYWCRHRNASPDWKPGSRWEHQDYDDPRTVDLVGDVIENDSPSRLVISWRFPTGSEDTRVTFAVEPFMDDAVRLTVKHENLVPDSDMDRGIRMGWPVVLSSLKTLLETGRPLAMTARRWHGDVEKK